MITIRAGTNTKVHTNMALRFKGRNAKKPIAIVIDGQQKRAKYVGIYDARGKLVAEVLFKPRRRLPSGAYVWIETRSKVKYR